MNTSRLGETAAELMEEIATELGHVLVIVELNGPSGGIYYRCSDERTWIQRGLLHAALELEMEDVE